jgi:hypothetical protein
MPVRVAIDVDSTLAATSEVAFDLLHGPDHDYDYSDITRWDWGTDKFGTDAYLSALWHSWTLRPEEIEPMDETSTEAAQVLNKHPEVTIPILTKHPDHRGISAGKEWWLEAHGIPSDSFTRVEMDASKLTYGYDYYIDDSPHLVANAAESSRDVDVLLYDQPYNRAEQLPIGDTEYTRVTTLGEAVEHILSDADVTDEYRAE